MKNEKFTPKDSNWKKSKSNVQGFKHKRKWVPEQNVYEGSIKEGKFRLTAVSRRVTAV